MYFTVIPTRNVGQEGMRGCAMPFRAYSKARGHFLAPNTNRFKTPYVHLLQKRARFCSEV